MEVLLIACLLAYTAGTQSEKSRMGLSPAQRAILHENTRHEKAVQKIADKHGVATPASDKAGISPWKNVPDATDGSALTLPDAFRSGYRGHSAVHRVATPMGRRVGNWAARGVAWGEDTGKGALREYRRRRRAAGYQDPAPVLVPLPPNHPPAVPPMPTTPPTAGAGGDTGVSMKKPVVPPAVAAKPVDPAPPPAPAPAAATTAPEPIPPAPGPPAAVMPPPTEQEPAPAGEGVGRMAAEVSYDSVMDESDELTAMCGEDLHTYDRIKKRAEREVGRGDTLAAQVQATGFGTTILALVIRCREQYQIIHTNIDSLKGNTIAQADAVVTAKDLLQRGQGVYADIAKDMEDVAQREAYVSDAVDAEDVNPEAEHYETKAAV